MVNMSWICYVKLFQLVGQLILGQLNLLNLFPLPLLDFSFFYSFYRLRFLSAINALFVNVEQRCSIQSSIELITSELMPQTFSVLYHLIVDEVI